MTDAPGPVRGRWSAGYVQALAAGREFDRVRQNVVDVVTKPVDGGALERFAEAVPVGDPGPVGRLARMIADVLTEFDLPLDGVAALAGRLFLEGVDPDGDLGQYAVGKWCSLVEPGDVIDGKVVIATQSGASTRSGPWVTITVAVPARFDRFDEPEWTDREELRFESGYDPVDVIEKAWPRRFESR